MNTTRKSPTAMQTSRLYPNSQRVRQPSEDQVAAMAKSIQAARGILQPIDVRLTRRGYEIQDGEVRWRAAGLLKMDIVPINVLAIDDVQSADLELIHNMERETISSEEIISNLEQLVKQFDVAAAEIVLEQIGGLDLESVGPELQARARALLDLCNGTSSL
ncbi:ParB/RepB/Spo0J family partition protein [Pseudomonas guariconensis]|uniref:ParB/RepB/Spo0J family partition protein n=1 Tax=Pseudomonas guariconensis TaxID=1288410 RepID=UPI003905C58F